jgi:hypothetical protein
MSLVYAPEFIATHSIGVRVFDAHIGALGGGEAPHPNANRVDAINPCPEWVH